MFTVPKVMLRYGDRGNRSTRYQISNLRIPALPPRNRTGGGQYTKAPPQKKIIHQAGRTLWVDLTSASTVMVCDGVWPSKK